MNARPAARQRHSHIDRRAPQIAEQLAADSEADDKAYNTIQTAKIIGCSSGFLESARCTGGGPPFRRISPKMIRYLKSDLIAWLRSRERHFTTAEYTD